MQQYFVLWQPPYSTSVKEQPCAYLQEAELMRDWFRSIGVPADIVSRIPMDTLIV